MESTTFISADNTWALMAITCGWVAFSIYAEQTWAWASKLSGAIIALIGALVLTNLNIIPTSAVWFDDIIWGYVVPLAIPLLLLQCDIRKIWKDSGRMLIIYLIGAIGTATSAMLAYTLLKGSIPEPAGVAAMMTGSYIGGGVNLATVSAAFEVSGETLSATTVADNMLMACYFFVLIAIPSSALFRRWFKHPHVAEVEAKGADENAKTQAAAYWDRKPISLRDIAFNFAISTIIVSLSTELSGLITAAIPATNTATTFINGVLGNKYLLMTTIAMLVATFGSKQVAKVSGSQELGTFLIYLFLFVIGVPASISLILQNAPMLFVFCFIMVAVNMLFSFGFGKLLKFDMEEIILASNANIGGPTTAAAMAISQGWVKLVGPVMLIGTLGYVIGTYAGISIGVFLGA
ncbi:DUF819 domain-containing protein [Chakrabartyella piscis]|uniref:DUF819 family protein n=1 Tax=Chakrabartyella piscis TaxID=2918914 RepID=UPI002958DEFF|nr:DUF819 family protein [Chakrabartyella piscis]